MLKDIIDTANEEVATAEQTSRDARQDIEDYVLAQTVTVQELYDIIKAECEPFVSSAHQTSTWTVIDTAKKAILAREPS